MSLELSVGNASFFLLVVQVMGILEHGIVGVVVFVTTEIDDLVVLVALYADPQLRNRAIVAGRLLGMGALTATSAVAAVAALTIPSGWTALLGFAPLVLGLRPLLRDEAGDDEAIGQEHVHEESRRTRESVYSQTLAVSSITIANGGDNLGVYIPLFAKRANNMGTVAEARNAPTNTRNAAPQVAVAPKVPSTTAVPSTTDRRRRWANWAARSLVAGQDVSTRVCCTPE